jgi:hypothetical protein
MGWVEHIRYIRYPSVANPLAPRAPLMDFALTPALSISKATGEGLG